MITASERMALYKRIFASIPRSFLDPTAVESQQLIGAIALACAHTEKIYRDFERGLFLDSADLETPADGSTGGVSSLDRWGIWLQMPREPGESAEAYRLRLMTRMYTPKVTIAAIRDAVQRVTGHEVEIVEPQAQVVRMNDGPWAGKKLLGKRYGYMNIEIVTHGPTNALPSIVPFLRAAGVHWRHIEVVVHELLLLWEAEQASTQVWAWDWINWWPDNYRLNNPLDPDARPLQARYLWSAGTAIGFDFRTDWGAGAVLVSGHIDAPIKTVEAVFVPAGLPVLNMDDSLTLWDESVWGD